MQTRFSANFDRLAKPYSWLEYLTFGPLLMRCRCEYIHELLGCRHALVLGDGDGRFLARLLAAAPELRADVVDSSEAMLRLLSQRVASAKAGDRVALWHADALLFAPPARPYDLVVSHFFLDCFDDRELAGLFTRIAPALAPGALWVLSDFNVPPFHGWKKIMEVASQALVGALYVAFRITTGLRVRSLPDHATAMRNHGLQIRARRTRLAGLLVSEVWSAGDERRE